MNRKKQKEKEQKKAVSVKGVFKQVFGVWNKKDTAPKNEAPQNAYISLSKVPSPMQHSSSLASSSSSSSSLHHPIPTESLQLEVNVNEEEEEDNDDDDDDDNDVQKHDQHKTDQVRVVGVLAKVLLE